MKPAVLVLSLVAGLVAVVSGLWLFFAGADVGGSTLCVSGWIFDGFIVSAWRESRRPTPILDARGFPIADGRRPPQPSVTGAATFPSGSRGRAAVSSSASAPASAVE